MYIVYVFQKHFSRIYLHNTNSRNLNYTFLLCKLILCDSYSFETKLAAVNLCKNQRKPISFHDTAIGTAQPYGNRARNAGVDFDLALRINLNAIDISYNNPTIHCGMYLGRFIIIMRECIIKSVPRRSVIQCLRTLKVKSFTQCSYSDSRVGVCRVFVRFKLLFAAAIPCDVFYNVDG